MESNQIFSLESFPRCGVPDSRGVPAVSGTDAEIKLYEVEAPKPQVYDSGNVNHYELNLIHRVEKGDWLGERKDPPRHPR